jgi:hypothetical protein
MQPTEHEFRLTADEWERAVIANAAYFTCFRRLGRGRCDKKVFGTMGEALAEAAGDRRALVYAVTVSGRSTLVPR